MLVLLLLVLGVVAYPSWAWDNGLGLTPPMGWNSWNHFHCDIDETLIQQTAQAMVDLGLDRLGYQYINLDDCWQIRRNASGYIQEDTNKFPSGIPALAEQVHSLGLKFGLYSDAGIKTCQGRPGGFGYETEDATTYAEWDIDYLKYDNCFNLGLDVHTRYQRMHDALNQTGHPIYFSLCEWGYKDPATWARPVGNSWRTTSDIEPTWDSIMKNLDLNDRWHSYAGPGGWNDPDMLQVGNGELTLAEQRSHFTLWCLIKAPLLLGNDIRNLLSLSLVQLVGSKSLLDSHVLNIITNQELIAWNQDVLGKQGYKRQSSGRQRMLEEQLPVIDTSNVRAGDTDATLEVWAGELSGGNIAVVLFNRSSKDNNITAFWKDIGLAPGTMALARDVWLHQDLGAVQDCITSMVPSHDVVAIQLSPYSNLAT